jgi:serine protease Do
MLSLAPTDEPGSAKRGSDPTRAPGAAGLRLAPLDAAMRERLDIPARIKSGVVVGAVLPGGPASEAGLQVGDVIVEANRQPVSSPERFAELWTQAKQAIALMVWRQGHTFYAVLEP